MDVGLCTGVGGSGGVGGRVGVNGAGGVRSGGRVGGDFGDSDGAGWIGAGIIGGTQLCGSGFLGRVVGVLRWWWHWRVLDWCRGLAEGWPCGIG